MILLKPKKNPKKTIESITVEHIEPQKSDYGDPLLYMLDMKYFVVDFENPDYMAMETFPNGNKIVRITNEDKTQIGYNNGYKSINYFILIDENDKCLTELYYTRLTSNSRCRD